MKKVMTHPEVIALGKRLEEVCRAEDGHAVYAAGHSDQTVAAEMGLVVNNVSRLRGTICGLVRKPKPESETAGAIRVMQDRIDALEAWAHAWPVAPFKIK